MTFPRILCRVIYVQRASLQYLRQWLVERYTAELYHIGSAMAR